MCIICYGKNIEGLEELYCNNCPSLTHLPEQLPEGLKKFVLIKLYFTNSST